MATLLFLLIHLASSESSSSTVDLDCTGKPTDKDCSNNEFTCISNSEGVDTVFQEWCQPKCFGSDDDKKEFGECKWEAWSTAKCDENGSQDTTTRTRAYKFEGYKGCEGTITEVVTWDGGGKCDGSQVANKNTLTAKDHECKKGLSPAVIAAIVIGVIVVIVIVVVVVIFCCCGAQCGGGGGNKRHYY